MRITIFCSRVHFWSVQYHHQPTLIVEVFFHLRAIDRLVPENSLYSLTEELVQAMAGIFYTDVAQVEQFISYKAMSSSGEGMIMIVLKNEINSFYENDFDENH